MKIFLPLLASLPLIHSRRVGVRYKRMYVHELLFNLDQEKVWLGGLTIPPCPFC